MLTVSEIIKTVDSDEQLFERVESCLNDFKNNFCRLGFMLRVLKERGYDNAYLMDRFGLSKSTINRSIQINEQFSENGYSYKLDEKYSDFKKSQLVEMLPLSQEQREEVSVDMSVADIRDLKNSEDDEDFDDDFEECSADTESVPEEKVELPEYDLSKNVSAVREAIAKALSEIPEVGRDINKMVNYVCNRDNPHLYFVVDNINFYIKFTGSCYLYVTSDDVKIIGYFYLYSYSLGTYPEFMKYSDVDYYPEIKEYLINNKIAKYCVDCWDDWDYVCEHMDDVSLALINNLPLKFEIEDKYSIEYLNGELCVSYLHYKGSDCLLIPSKNLKRFVESYFYAKLEELFLKALSDNVIKCKHVYSFDGGDLFICDHDKKFSFMFELQVDGTIELCFGLSGKDYDGLLLEKIEFKDYFPDWDCSALDVFFLLCTDKDIKSALKAYK